MQHGLSLLWVVIVAVTLQTIFNTEVMRYTLATGEPVFTGFMRTEPSSTLWAWVYAALLYFLQVGWPAWAGTAAAAIFFLFARAAGGCRGCGDLRDRRRDVSRLRRDSHVGRRIERTLELLNWVLVVTILGGFLVLTLLFVPADAWAGPRRASADSTSFAARSIHCRRAPILPAGCARRLFGIGRSGEHRAVELGARSRLRHGRARRLHSGAAGGERGHSRTPASCSTRTRRRWNAGADGGASSRRSSGACSGSARCSACCCRRCSTSPSCRAAPTFRAWASAPRWRQRSGRTGRAAAGIIAFLGAWMLFKTQLDNLEGMVRAITDILWTGSRRVRAWRGGDVRAVYYTVLAVLVVWGLIAMRLAQPIVLLQLGANVAGAIFVIAAPHLLYINTRLLPPHVRPPMWRRVALVVMTLFYGFFVALSFGSLFTARPRRLQPAPTTSAEAPL